MLKKIPMLSEMPLRDWKGAREKGPRVQVGRLELAIDWTDQGWCKKNNVRCNNTRLQTADS